LEGSDARRPAGRVKGDKPMTLYIGIDPGASGGLACLTIKGVNRLTGVRAEKMPTTDADVWLSVRNLRSSPLLGEGQSIAAVIEQVGGFIGVGQPGSAMFKFGQSYGALRMALVAAGIPFETVPPQKW
jgi:hypothetical protein